jgi:UDP:flavonoid glycosyltransferase YjiC (YdhE family)
VLALFSPLLAQRQQDWPIQTVQPGFVYFDDSSALNGAAAEVESFLAPADAPIVFAQGSAAVHNPGNFYEVSAKAARRLHRRALLIGAIPGPSISAPDLLAARYVPYSQIFPRAAAIVHQGGAGTTAQALRAGRPTLVVPYGWDQPDNAARIEKLGTGLALARASYEVGHMVAKLQKLLEDPRYATRATQVSARLADEHALTRSCDAIERLLLSRAAVRAVLGRGRIAHSRLLDTDLLAKKLRAAHVGFVSSGATMVPKDKVGFSKGALVSDPDEHNVLLIQN